MSVYSSIYPEPKSFFVCTIINSWINKAFKCPIAHRYINKQTTVKRNFLYDMRDPFEMLFEPEYIEKNKKNNYYR